MVFRHLLATLILGLVVAVAAPVASVRASEPLQLTQQDLDDLERLESHLRSIGTLEARFIQVSSDGGFARGTLWLDRPGKMRFEYDPPVPILMIANGLELLYYDRELEQPTFVPLWQTPLWLVLKEEATLSDGIEVMGFRRSPAELSVRVRDAGAPDGGELVLRFAEQPLSLLGWTVIDAQGIATEVSLVDPLWGVAVDSARFESRGLPNVGLGR
ncbi:LolA family protein [Algihabitans albus]|uniref:LolA family protein n=1 Tax=Algihabitans albus TaxID=2164067 RepID=UPI000E5C6A04|nr:outer membrane lipoprotein carrier protein LolA [Algihabitans albus]